MKSARFVSLPRASAATKFVKEGIAKPQTMAAIAIVTTISTREYPLADICALVQHGVVVEHHGESLDAV